MKTWQKLRSDCSVPAILIVGDWHLAHQRGAEQAGHRSAGAGDAPERRADGAATQAVHRRSEVGEAI
jgi:hypothetical protein